MARILWIVLILVFNGCCNNVACVASNARPFFIVKDVFVDAEDKNATKAKEKALQKGDIQAISEAIKAITESNQGNGFMNLIRENPSSYILDFTIKEEKITPTKYEAFITYRIEKDKLIKFLTDNQVALKPGAESIVSIRSKDLYGHEVVVENSKTSLPTQDSSVVPSRTPEKANADDNNADSEKLRNTIKVKTRSLQEWLRLSKVLSRFIKSNVIFVSPTLTILETADILIDDDLNQALNEEGFELRVLSDKTVVISHKDSAEAPQTVAEEADANQPPDGQSGSSPYSEQGPDLKPTNQVKEKEEAKTPPPPLEMEPKLEKEI